VTGTSTVDAFDPETKRFTLKEARETKPGEQFETYPPNGANWDLHDNTISDCLAPVALDCYGSATTRLRNNTLARGSATGIKQALSLSGRVELTGNLFSGFEEPGSATLALQPDRFGKPVANVMRGNLFDHCGTPVTESARGLWQACQAEGNSFTACGKLPGK